MRSRRIYIISKDSSDNINTLWIKWFFGDKLLKIGPFRNIKPTWDLSSKEVKLYSKLSIVINKLIDIALNQKYIENKDVLRNMTEGDHNQLFNRSYRYFYLVYHQNQDPNHLTGNVATLSFTYMYSIIKKNV